MKDLIERQAVLDVLCVGAKLLKRVLDDTDVVGQNRETYSWGLGVIESFINDINEIPTAQPERKTGKWIECNPQNSDKCRLIECDQCGFSHIVGFNVPYEHWIENRNFCERCGADMRGEAE